MNILPDTPFFKRYLPISIGLIYIWFGTLKFFPGMSPAQDLAIATIEKLTFDLLSPRTAIVALASLETAIGILILFGATRKLALIAAIVHMSFTFTPFLFFPELCFDHPPLGLSIVGQYILKNLVILFVLILLLRHESRKNLS